MEGTALRMSPPNFFYPLYLVRVSILKVTPTPLGCSQKGVGYIFRKNLFENHFSKNGWATLRPNGDLISEDGAADCPRCKHYWFTISRRTSSAFRVLTSQVRQFVSFGICVFRGGRCLRINSPSFRPISSSISSLFLLCAR